MAEGKQISNKDKEVDPVQSTSETEENHQEGASESTNDVPTLDVEVVPDEENNNEEDKKPLSADEMERLKILEQEIEEFIQSVFRVGQALEEIREKKLYRNNYDTFDKYIEAHFDFSRPRAYQIMKAFRIRDILESKGVKTLPSAEYQLRALTRYLNEKRYKNKDDREAKIVNAWEEAVQKCDDKLPTESDVRAVVVEIERENTSTVQGLAKEDVIRVDKTEGEQQLYGQGGFYGIITWVGTHSVNFDTPLGKCKTIHPQYIRKLTSEQYGEEYLKTIRTQVSRLGTIYKKSNQNKLVKRIVKELASKDSLDELDEKILNVIEGNIP